MKTILITFLSLALIVACGKKNPDTQVKNDSIKSTSADTAQKEVPSDTSDEEKAINLVMDLPEVKDQANIIETESKGKHHLAAMILETPEENGQGYYFVKVSEDNEQSLVGIYSFYVYLPSEEIKFYDPIEDNVISLEEWRKQRNE